MGCGCISLVLQVSEFCVPLRSEVSPETPMVVEGTSEDVLRPDLVTKLRIRGITEGVPEVDTLLKSTMFLFKSEF